MLWVTLFPREDTIGTAYLYVFRLELLRHLRQDEGQHRRGDLVQLVHQGQHVLRQLRLRRTAWDAIAAGRLLLS